MRKLLFTTFFLVLNCFLLEASLPECVPNKEGVLLLTYPRTGTNWTIGILQTLCQRPVRFLDPKIGHPLGENRLGFKVDERLPFVYRSHKVTDKARSLNVPSYSLICTLRNYKECIVKENKYSCEQFVKAVLNNEASVSNYFDNLVFFDSVWKNPQTKHLAVYEEIVLNPQKQITSLLTFLGEDLSGVPKFMDNYETWNKAMLSSYHEQHARRGPPSNNELIFHSKDFPKDQLMIVDKVIKARYPQLWDKYLKRYAEAQ